MLWVVNGCYKIKYNSNGIVEYYKARLVARGYHQRDRIDYEETFAPIAKIINVRTIFSLVAKHNWPLYHLDVQNAFLYKDLLEEVYMEMPLGLR